MRKLFDDIVNDMYVPLHSSPFFNESTIIPEERIIAKIESLPNLELRDRDGRTLLINATVYSRLKVMKYLIAKGVDINAKDSRGFTALHASVMANSLEAVHLLIDAGADLSVKNIFGNNVLFVATSETNLEIIRLLTEKGANPDEKNNYGVSPREKFAGRPGILTAMMK